MGSEDVETQKFAVAALRELVCTQKHAKQMVLCERLIPLLCLASLSAPLELNRQISASFRNSTRHTEFAPMILSQHTVPGLMQLLLVGFCAAGKRFCLIEKEVPFVFGLLNDLPSRFSCWCRRLGASRSLCFKAGAILYCACAFQSFLVTVPTHPPGRSRTRRS